MTWTSRDLDSNRVRPEAMHELTAGYTRPNAATHLCASTMFLPLYLSPPPNAYVMNAACREDGRVECQDTRQAGLMDALEADCTMHLQLMGCRDTAFYTCRVFSKFSAGCKLCAACGMNSAALAN